MVHQQHNSENFHNISVSYDPFVEHPVPTSIGLFLLAIVMVTLNLVAIVVFVKKQRTKPPVDYPLLSLLIANLLQGTVTLPAYALKKIYATDSDRLAIFCFVYRFSYFLCTHATILSLLASSFDRVIALVYSLRYWQIVTKRRICAVIAMVWLFVIAFDVIPMFAPSDKRGTPRAACNYIPTKEWSVSMHVIMNIIPFPILLVNYVITVRIAFKHAERAQLDKSISTNSSCKQGRRDKLNTLYNMRATRKVLLIIGSYFVCVGPACVYYLLEWLCKSCFTKTYKEKQEQYMHFVLKILVNLNAVISPVIFFWKSKVFRSSAKEIFSIKDRFSAERRDMNSSFGDRYRLTKTLTNEDSPDISHRPNNNADRPSLAKSLFKRVQLKKDGGEGGGELLLEVMKRKCDDQESNGVVVAVDENEAEDVCMGDVSKDEEIVEALIEKEKN
eukprot:gene147-759_t